MVHRDEIVAAARKYLEVPFQHHGRDKFGLDCVGLVLAVAEDLGLEDKYGVPLTRGSYTDYGMQPQGNMVYRQCIERLIYRPVRRMQPGDVVTLAIPSEPCHLGFVGDDAFTGEFTLIHAYSGAAHKVVEHDIDYRWHNRIVGVVTFPGVK